ncbi:MAG TPA: pyruvate, phosphate dikinase [Bacteroidetes bacterium]|nr:pyruvate, phosphate dikinase [Bacteroidota bacterium]
MKENDKSVEHLLRSLKERAKELNCLYEVEELFSKSEITLDEISSGIVRSIPAGWQYPEVCVAQVEIDGAICASPGFRESPWALHAALDVQGEIVGSITVCYLEERPAADEGPFFKEERKLINTIADRLERRILHEKLKRVFENQKLTHPQDHEWEVIIDLLRRTDPKLLTRLLRKMLNYLSWAGIEDADRILATFNPSMSGGSATPGMDDNRPVHVMKKPDLLSLTEEIFRIASDHLSEKEILNNIQNWIKEDRSGFLVKILENAGSSLAEISSAIERFHHLSPQGIELSSPRERAFRVSLIRRLLSDHPQFINTAKQYLDVNDFYELLHRVIYPAGSHGRLGGKGAGLFLASNMLQKSRADGEDVSTILTPKTWYLTSDGILNFINYNDLEEIVEQKYEDIGQVRQEYPYIVHVFKNSPLPPEIVTGLSVALDDFGDTPLIVRSSSLLEDRLGTSFAGKYKSLFIANQGTKQQRLVALMDAITEVYASTFGPDPIEYRLERRLLDSHEEMGVLIQEVIGVRVGEYYLPAFSGVAFSNNEFRWSKRIRREDGLLRMVPGLGTRAVDRMTDDYPVLVAPGQPGLRVNVTLDEQVRYSPRKVDVINLRSQTFETVDLRDLIERCSDDYPLLDQLVSILRDNRFERFASATPDPETGFPVATFEGLISRSPFVEQMKNILGVLQREFRMPVDIEFAHDGRNLYLLQCRPQSYSETSQPAIIPRDIPRHKVLFTANRYVSNGTVAGITHIVYVDPQRYAEIKRHADLVAVGKAIGRLNQSLPKRQFILIGPGRWGSRGDIKLGVSVTYSDISNTAMLIEVARKQREYEPELSFGTHFFQDLVEADIRYLPLYPDETGTAFNESFFTQSPNVLKDLLPDMAQLESIVRVIDVPASTNGLVVSILMNGETDEAVGLLGEPSAEPVTERAQPSEIEASPKEDDSHWRWRLRTVHELTARLDPSRFGVKAAYIFGSTKNATAGPKSDINLLLHFTGTSQQKKELVHWLEGWSLSLGHMNYLRTGIAIERFLDVHFITDEDIRKRTSYAAKIGATTDPARPLPVGGKVPPSVT